MAEIVPEGTLPTARVEHFEVGQEDSDFTSVRAVVTGGRDGHVPVGRYARLFVDGGLMMSDTPMEHRSNSTVVYQANGDVLIGGLGLGMIAHAIAAKPEVTSVTVIEKNPDVIKLVGPTVPKKVTVIEGDIFTWRPAKGVKYDVIYFDIWADLCTTNLEEMAKLHMSFSRRLNRDNPKHWMHSWEKETLKYYHEQERRQEPYWR